MGKISKSISYLIACAAVFAAVVAFSGSGSEPATAFEWEKKVNVYFLNSDPDSDENCSKVFPVSRTVLNAETLGPGALEALLRGVSESEKALGYWTALNEDVLVQKFEIKEGVAYVDFDPRFNEGVAGSCKVTAIKSQIENTLNNLPDIDAVVISVNGQTEGVLEP